MKFLSKIFPGINWEVRLKNSAWLTTFAGVVVGFVYQMMDLFGITIPVGENAVLQVVGLVITALVGLGVIIDPTTAGLNDSKLAQTYTEPKKDME